MGPKLPNPEWPQFAKDALIEAQKAVISGCGGCALSEWVGVESIVNLRETPIVKEVSFHLALCRAGVILKNGDPIDYCTLSTKNQFNDAPNGPSQFSETGIARVERPSLMIKKY